MAKRYSGPGALYVADAEDFNYLDYDLAICFLVFMFISLDKWRNLFENLIGNIRPGGALVIVDKMSFNGYMGTIMHRPDTVWKRFK
jgi:tRNA (cmo5U34)-methyltransferase